MEKEEFLGILKTKKSAPFLFLGSGFTNYHNLESEDNHFGATDIGIAA